MGGLIFIIPSIVATLLLVRNTTGLCVILFSLAFGLVGFLDDYIKVVKKRNLGLTEKQKFSAQLIASVIFVYVSLKNGVLSTDIAIPFVEKTIDLGYLYMPFAILVTLGTTNAVNLTDGVDGLATSVTSVVCVFMAVIAYMCGNLDVAVLSLILLGGCLGFFVFNRHPAKVFMGDTGSLFLGGAVCAMALSLKMPVYLVIIGGVYVIETLSVIIQVASFKLTGKRVFKMSPVHHHFEMSGFSENKIVCIAVLTSVVLGLIAVGGVYLG
jgi:phospho-N-acetylmuramoyl-pentapeptide-transferase